MPNVLEMQIVSDISGLEKGLKQAEKLQAEYTASIEKTSKELADNIAVTNSYKKSIEQLTAEFKKGGISNKEYTSQMQKLKTSEAEAATTTENLRKELSTLKKEQKEVGNAFDTTSKKTANGGNALMQFSRIAQDAPFGIQGIGNNITATTEAFGALQKQTGSTGAALKAVGASMLGSGGILLAVSLVTTGLTYMAQNGLTVGDVFDKLTGKFDANAQALAEIGAEAAKNASTGISEMKALAAAAANTSLKDGERLFAVRELQKEYPAYFGNLSQEAILNGNVAGAVKGVTEALIAKAKASVFSSRIADLAEKEFLLNSDINKEIKTLVKNYGLTTEQAKKFAKEVQNGADAFQLLEPFKKNVGFFDVASAVSATGSIKDLKEELAANLATQKSYTAELDKSTAATVKFDSANAKAAADLKAKEEAAKAAAAKAKKISDAAAKAAEKGAKLRSNVIPFELKIEPKTGDLSKLALPTGTFDELGIEINQKLGEIKVAPIVLPPFNVEAPIDSFDRALQAADVLNDGIGSAIGGLGNEIAGSLQTGISALDAFTGSVIHSLADIASAQLAGLIEKKAIAAVSLETDAAVATGNAVVAGTETAAASGPAAAFVLPALVGAAIGFIAASFAGIKFAHGGVVPGGSYTGDKIPAMLNSGEAVMNSQQQANTLMAIANGNSNSLQGNRQSSNFTLETKLRGSDLLLVTKREERKR